MSWKNVSYLLGSRLSMRILESLASSKDPLAPLQISRKTDIARSNVSTKLSELRKRKLVECINPEDRKWRFYRITAEGRRTLDESKKALRS